MSWVNRTPIGKHSTMPRYQSGVLHAEGAWMRPHCLENLVTHRAKKFWQSCDCSSIRMPLHVKSREMSLCNSPIPKVFLLKIGRGWFPMHVFTIGHPCYFLLTPAKTRYVLTSITWPYCRLMFTAWGHVYFEVDSFRGTGYQLDRGLSQVNLLQSGAPLLG